MKTSRRGEPTIEKARARTTPKMIAFRTQNAIVKAVVTVSDSEAHDQ